MSFDYADEPLSWTLRKSGAAGAGRQAHLGCWMMDLATNTFLASDEVYRIFGITSRVNNIDINFILTHVHPDDQEMWLNSTLQSMAIKKIQTLDLRIVREDGAIRQVHAEGDFNVDDEGNVISVFGILEDITDRLRMEAALRESEERYQKILNSAQIGVVLIDPATHDVIEANDKALSMFNVSRERVVGAVCHQFICPAERGKCPVTDLKQVVDVSERSVLKADGEKIPVLKTVVTERIGDRDVLVESFMDLTQLKAAEHALFESEEKFRVLAETTSSAIFILQGDQIAYANPAATAITGYTADDVAGMKFWEIVHPEHRDMVRKRYAARQQGPDAPQRYEIKIVNRAGETRWLEINAGTAEYRHIPAVLITAFDVTDRKRTEEKLLVSLHEKEVLLQEIHHRVKNNMQIISSLLGLQAGQINDPKTIEALRNSQHRVRSLALIHEMLYQTDNFTRINFKEYIGTMTSYLLQSYNIDREKFRVVPDIGDVSLEIERAIPLGLIINELVTNAIKHAFCGRDEGTITIQLRGDPATGRHQLIVGDDGVGLAPDMNLADLKTFGIELVITLVGQLDGTIELEKTGGTRYKITF